MLHCSLGSFATLMASQLLTVRQHHFSTDLSFVLLFVFGAVCLPKDYVSLAIGSQGLPRSFLDNYLRMMNKQ